MRNTTGKTKQLRLGRVKALRPKMPLLTQNKTYNIIFIMLCLNDLIVSYSLWDKMIGESWYKSLCVSAAFVIMLDISLAVAGNAVKQYTCGLRSKKDTVFVTAVFVFAFSVLYFVYLTLRVSMSNDLFGSAAAGAAVDKVSGESAAHVYGAAVKYATSLYQAFSPFCTSLIAFGISYAVSDPISERLDDCEKAKIILEAKLTEINKALEGTDEHGGCEVFRGELIRRDDELYGAFLRTIDDTAAILKVRARKVLCVKVGNADAVTYLSDEIAGSLAQSPAEDVGGVYRVGVPSGKAPRRVPNDNDTSDGSGNLLGA